MSIVIDGCRRTFPDRLGMGVFDGLHLGHRALSDCCDALLSFTPHPAEVLGTRVYKGLLSTPEELSTYFPWMMFLHFTKEVAALSPEAFLESVVWERLRPREIVVGYDFHFGARKAGNPEFLRRWCREKGIACRVIEPFIREGKPVKSSTVRDCVADGEFDRAVALMGHPYLMIGEVVRGEGRGRELGFPTANLQLPAEKLIPAAGVYGGFLMDSDQKVIVYIGRKPTFDGQFMGVEVHVLDFEGDLYGKRLAVMLTSRIRGEMTFSSGEALVAQIRRDISVFNSR